MKKLFVKWLPVLALAVLGLMACNKNNGNDDEPLTPDESKTKIEDAAVAAVNEVDAADFEQVAEVGVNTAAVVEENDMSAATDDYTSALITNVAYRMAGLDLVSAMPKEVALASARLMTEMAGTVSTQGRLRAASDFLNQMTKVKVDFGLLAGEFVLEDTVWVFNEVDENALVLKFKDAKNRDVEFALTWGDDCSEVSLPLMGYEWHLALPEEIVISAKMDGESVAKITVKSDLSLQITEDNEDNWDIQASFESLYVALEAGGYKLYGSTADKGATVATEGGLYKGESPILAASAQMELDETVEIPSLSSDIATSALGIIVSMDLDDLEDLIDEMAEDGSLLEWLDYAQNAINTSSATLDVMGLMQIQAKVDVRDLVKGIVDLSENIGEDDEMTEQVVTLWNSYVKLGIYFDGKGTEQAYIALEKVVYDLGGYDYEDYAPVLVFTDGSKYTFEEYFTEDDFAQLTAALDKWAAEMEAIIQKYWNQL